MEPVRIRCQQCNGRLVIRTPELLGKSVHCPRCQSIIQVPVANTDYPTSAWAENNPVLPPSFDSTAITRVQDSLESHFVDTQNQNNSNPTSTPANKINSFDDDRLFPDLSDLPGGVNGTESFLDLPAATDTEFSDSEANSDILNAINSIKPKSPTVDRVNRSTAKKRLVLMVGFSGLIATIFAVTLFVTFLNSFRSKEISKKPLQVDGQQAVDNRPNEIPSTEKPIAENPIAENLSAEKPSTEKEGTPIAPTEPNKVSPEPAPVLKSQETSLPGEEPIQGKSNPTTSNSDRTNNDDGSKTVPIDGVGEKKNETPPPMSSNIVPELNLGGLPEVRGSGSDSKEPQANEVTMTPPPSLTMFAPVFELGGNGFSSDAATTEMAAPEFNSAGGIVDLGLLTHPPAVLNPAWDEAKATPILKLAVNQQPISQAILILGQISGFGFGWDPASFRYGALDLNQRVSISASDSTIEAELNSLVKATNADKQVVAPNAGSGEQVMLLPLASDIKMRLPTDWSIDDLATSDPAILQWERLLKVHFKHSNAKWRIDDRKLVWTPEASPIDQAEIAAFLDQTRHVLGLPMKSGFANPSVAASIDSMNRTALITPFECYQQAFIRLRNTGESMFGEVLSGPLLLDQAARECKLDLLLDWPAILSHGFSHSATNLSIFRNRTWPQIAKRLLDQFDLVAVVDGPQRIIVTTLEQQRQRAVSTTIKRSENETLESIGEKFRILSPTDDKGHSTLVVTQLPKVDPNSKNEYVVVKHCHPNTKQLELLEVRRALQIKGESP